MPNVAAAPRTRVLIAGVSTRAMAASAARAGYDVTALDAFGDLDQHAGVRALSLPRDFGLAFSARALVTAAADIDCDAIAYLSPFENHPSAVRRLEHRAPLWGNSAAVLERARNPEVLLAAGREYDDATANPTRWLLKPRASGGGHGIRAWQPGHAIPASAYVQPFIDGTPGSIVFVAAKGIAVPLGLTRQLIGETAFGADGFRYCGSMLASSSDAQFDDDAQLFDAAVSLASRLARELALVGVNCIDFVARHGVPIPVEVNPRWSSSMELVERAHGVSIFGVHAAACTTARLPSFDLGHARRERRATAKAIVFARHDIVCGDTTTWLADATVRDVPHPGEHIPARRPVCTVFADAGDSYDCYAALVQRAHRLDALLESWSSVPA